MSGLAGGVPGPVVEVLKTAGLMLFLGVLPGLGQQKEAGVLVGTIESVAPSESLLVYLEGIGGEPADPPDAAVMDQEGEVFLPHLLAVRSGQSVRFKNSDPFTHNVHLFRGRRSLFNRAQSIGGHSDWTPPRPGEYLVLCDIHRKMSAYVFVFDHPFFATVEGDGASTERSFKIEGVPAGTHTLVVVRDEADKGILKKRKEPVTIVPGGTARVTIRF